MKLLITGGHITPALAVIDKLQQSHQDIELVFVGRKYIEADSRTLSWESREIEKRKIKFINLQTGRLTRLLTLRSFKHLLKIPGGFMQANKILNSEKPDIILSFGGYLALPIAIAAYFKKIPVFTHEQTIYPGLANQIIAKFAKKIFISFSESQKYFDQKKVIVTGDPIRQTIFKIIDKPFEVDKNKPVIYISGGSLGSHSINEHIKKIIAELLNRYIVIHQTGDIKEYNDYEELLNIKNNLPEKLQKNYYISKHFADSEIGYIYSLTDLAVGRCGANTFFEFLALGKPALFIPLPWSAHGEQQKQAEIFAQNKIGEVFDQSGLSDQLLSLIEKMIDNLASYKKNFENLKEINKPDAAKTIINYVIAKPM